VLTVVAPSTSSTTAVLQAWQKGGSGWVRHGPRIPADLGSAGLSAHPSESVSATPIGSFTLTRAFGADADPGTALPYLQTTPDDWWISQPGPLYNTLQTCASDCAFTQGDPNEHLRYETPFYNYAVVIDYNTADAGPIPQDQLVAIMRWLRPGDHPRILIGLGGRNG
jgi:L,D-peptidoglycan transpeptidase YkuD (ErfK/YbiS/YcfS/YnhG family)